MRTSKQDPFQIAALSNAEAPPLEVKGDALPFSYVYVSFVKELSPSFYLKRKLLLL